MQCIECIKAASSINPVYIMDCVGCAARLVISAMPWEDKQEAMLSHIAHHGKVTRAQVLEKVRGMK